MKMLKIEITDLETGEKLIDKETDCIIGAYHSMEELDREERDVETSVDIIALTRANGSTIINVGKGAIDASNSIRKKIITEILGVDLPFEVEDLFDNE